LQRLTGSAQWTIDDIDAVAALTKKNPWKGMDVLRQELTGPAAALGIAIAPPAKRRAQKKSAKR
jgi:hypothetical protein